MKQCGCSKNLSCGCCEGVEALTPQSTANRPGLSALYYRIGTHSTVFETMQARLSNFYLTDSETGGVKKYPLAGLQTRQPSDASLAILSGAAVVFDVLTVYQERIANEGFLQTATERRSVLELGRLVGYTPRPGVAASVHLAYTMDDKSDPVEIPKGARVQSIPLPKKPGGAPETNAVAPPGTPPAEELPQSFETSEKLEVRKEWNNLQPRASRPQNITIKNAATVRTVYFEGTETNLKPNSPLLFIIEGQGASPVLRRVETVEPLFDEQKTKVTLWLSEDNTFLELVERFSTNFDEFCIDPADSLKIAASGMLSDVRKSITDDPTAPEEEDIIEDIAQLIVAIDERGSAGMQKWLDSLTNEVTGALRALGIIDEWLREIREDNNFQAFLDDLEEIADKIPDFEETIKSLRQSDGFETLVRDLFEVARTLEGYDRAKLDTFIDRIGGEEASASSFTSFVNLTKPLSLSASKQPANSFALERSARQTFDLKNDTLPQMVAAFHKEINTNAYAAWANTTVTKPQPVKVYAPRVSAPLFGSTAAPRFRVEEDGTMTSLGEYPIVEVFGGNTPPPPAVVAASGPSINASQRIVVKHENERTIYLDASYDKIIAGSWIVVDMRGVTAPHENFELVPSGGLLITKAKEVAHSISRAEYGINAKTTRIDLGDARWIDYDDDEDLNTSLSTEFQLIRGTIVHAQSERLTLADAPINDDVCGSRIELAELYEGLTAGRFAIVSGERTDIPGTIGVTASELVMIKGVEQSFDPEIRGDRIHSTIALAARLAYTYKRKTVKIYGNVVKATHGETRSEVLGSGDATRAMQTFVLKQPPLTFVSAPTTSGIESTLEVRVNDIKWHEAETLAGLKPQDRKFIVKIGDDAQTSVIFGNGAEGARLPTGVENVRAVYRSGIGKPGNVKADQISVLITKPLGVREVVNPLRASGGADKETRDQARRNVPIALMALDRLVSTKDYADFARTFAGIGKARAARLSDGYRQVVHLTIAGADDIPIDLNSDLYNNLRRALAKYGNPFQPVQITVRELLALVLVAKVAIHPDYLWESVAPKIRTALFNAFSFERRELGQSVFLSEAASVIQKVEGVIYSDIDVLDSVSETDLQSDAAVEQKTDRWNRTAPAAFVRAHAARPNRLKPPAAPRIFPAQLAYLLPEVPDTLIINQITEVQK